MRISKPIISLGEALPALSNVMPFIHAGKSVLMFTDVRTFDSFTLQFFKPGPIVFIRLRVSSRKRHKTVYIGCVQSWGVYYPNKKLHDQYKHISEVISDVIRTRVVPDNFLVTHNGNCARCGKPLKTADSYMNGIGPECKVINRKENLSTGFFFC